ncbi:MAG: F0F1 ATP synthase subunit alpha, partial [Eubacteriales bacterium]
MNLRPEEISRIIKEQIRSYGSKTDQAEVGTVVLVGDGIARVWGLDNCMANELLTFDGGAEGMALNLEEDAVSVVLLSGEDTLKEGSVARRTGKVVSVPVGEKLLGRVVNALGQPIDGRGPIDYEGTRPVERSAPGI